MACRCVTKRFFGLRGWILLALPLIGLGVTLHLMLPPAPRWIIPAANSQGLLSADGKTLVLHSVSRQGLLLEGCVTEEVEATCSPLQVWDTHTGAQRGQLFANFPRKIGKGVNYSVDMRCVAVILEDDRIVFGDTQTLEEWTISLPTKKPDNLAEDAVWGLTALYSPNGEHFVFWEGEQKGLTPGRLHVVNVGARELLATLPALFTPNQGFSPQFNAQEDLLVYFAESSTGPLLTVYSTHERRVLRTLPEIDVKLGCDLNVGDQLMTRNKMEDHAVWDLRTGVCRGLGDCNGYVFPSPDGRVYAVQDGDDIHLRTGPDMSKAATLKTSKRLFMDFSPNSQLLWVACGHYDSAILNSTPQFGIGSTCVFSLPLLTSLNVYEANTGKQLWQEAGNKSVFGGLRFSPDSQFLIRGNRDGATILEAANGKVRGTLRLGGNLVAQFAVGEQPAITTSGDFVAVTVEVPQEPEAAWSKWLGSWSPAPVNAGETLTIVGQISTASEICRLRLRRQQLRHLSEDGRMLITCFDDNTNSAFAAWDLPSRPRWGWIAGVPLGLGLVTVLLRWWNSRRIWTVYSSRSA